jgi:hypothetical protein
MREALAATASRNIVVTLLYNSSLLTALYPVCIVV